MLRVNHSKLFQHCWNNQKVIIHLQFLSAVVIGLLIWLWLYGTELMSFCLWLYQESIVQQQKLCKYFILITYIKIDHQYHVLLAIWIEYSYSINIIHLPTILIAKKNLFVSINESWVYECFCYLKKWITFMKY